MDVRLLDGGALSPALERSHDLLLASMASSELPARFFSTLLEFADVDRIHCFEHAHEEAAPTLFCAWTLSSQTRTDLIDRYRVMYHRHDPIRSMLPRIPPSSSASIVLTSDEIDHVDYRRVCFEQVSIRHRLSVVKRVGGGTLTLSVGRRSRPFQASETQQLAMLGRLALPIFAQNERLKTKTESGNFCVPEMERRLGRTDKGFTQRELQVCARTIVGVSAEGTALDLGISIASVLTYRQRAYRRANVSNAMQLAGLVLH